MPKRHMAAKKQGKQQHTIHQRAKQQQGKQQHTEPRWRRPLVGLLIVLTGVLVVAYPLVSNYVNQQTQQEAIQLQIDAINVADQDTIDAIYDAAVEYNERLLDSYATTVEPFDPDAQTVTDEEYESLLNYTGDGVMAYLTIPAIKLYLPIYHGTSDTVLSKAIGHLQGSSLPVGGESTHVVLAGHTGLTNAEIFDNIDELEVGDYFIITVLGEDLAYEVTSIEIVLPEETDSLLIQEGEDLVTLVTCTPYGINSHRLLVHAERTEIPDEWLEKDGVFPDGYSSPINTALISGVLLGLGLAAIVIAAWRLYIRRRRRRLGKHALG